MKDLLTAIQTELQGALSYVRDADIYITEDEDLIPQAVKFPAVALKDGDVEWEVDASGPTKKQALYVNVIVYVQIVRPEGSVMGDGSHKGVLEIHADIKAELDENTLDSEVSDAEIVSEKASETIGDEKEMIQKKAATYKYERWNQ